MQSTIAHRILVVHGPNLNLLGSREPEVYGRDTLIDIDNRLKSQAAVANVTLETFQSNAEGALIDRIHGAKVDGVRFIVINPGAFTHTSIALRDALLAVEIPFIEVHLSNVHAREPFRKHSYLSDKAVGVICGLGAKGYEFAVEAAISTLFPVS
jgi:3-dehydroquinate dehydratase-2